MYKPWGLNTRRFIGTGEMPLFAPVTRSVSSSISFRTWSKSTNLWPFLCRNSAYSLSENNIIYEIKPLLVSLMSWRMSGLLVTIPLPRGKKSLNFENIFRLTCKILTSQQNSQVQMICRHSGHQQQRFEVNQNLMLCQVVQMHPAKWHMQIL